MLYLSFTLGVVAGVALGFIGVVVAMSSAIRRHIIGPHEESDTL